MTDYSVINFLVVLINCSLFNAAVPGRGHQRRRQLCRRRPERDAQLQQHTSLWVILLSALAHVRHLGVLRRVQLVLRLHHPRPDRAGRVFALCRLRHGLPGHVLVQRLHVLPVQQLHRRDPGPLRPLVPGRLLVPERGRLQQRAGGERLVHLPQRLARAQLHRASLRRRLRRRDRAVRHGRRWRQRDLRLSLWPDQLHGLRQLHHDGMGKPVRRCGAMRRRHPPDHVERQCNGGAVRFGRSQRHCLEL